MKAMLMATYSPAGLKGLMLGSDRKTVVAASLSQVGATLIDVEFTRGAWDVIVTAEFPDGNSLIGTAMAFESGGAFEKTDYLEIIDLPDVVTAANKAAGSYTPAG